jgi:transposase
VWYIGIDWADDHHDAAVVDEAGQQVAKIRVTHSAEGLHQLTAFLLEVATRQGPPGNAPDLERIACVVETNHGLLISALLEVGFPVYPVNPKTLERRRGPAGAKTDAIDAYLLAKKGRSDLADLRRLAPDSPLVQELKALTHDQDGLVQGQTRLVNQLTACLKAYYPVALTLFAKLQQPTTLAFLRAYPTLEAARAASVEELATFLKMQPHYPGPSQAAHRLWGQLHAPQLHADPVTTRAKTRLMLALVSQLVPLMEQLTAYDEEIRRLFLTHPDSQVFLSLPGTGKRLAPRLLAGWGDDRERFGSAASVQVLAGTAPVPYESGKFARARKRLACIKPLRNALYQFAWQSTTQEDWALAYYRRKRSEGKSHSVALRALANLWVRIIHALWLKRACYDPTLFLAAREAHARPAA